MFRFHLSLVLAAATAGSAMAQTPPPASAFARLPATVQAVISPNGEGIAILGGAPAARTLTFSVIDKPGVNVLRLGDVETIEVLWAGDAYAIARVAYFDKEGPRNAYRMVRNIAVTPDAKPSSTLLKGDQVSAYLVSQRMVGVVDGPKPRVIVEGLTLAHGMLHDANTNLQRKGEDNPFVPALFSVDPATGRGAQLEKGDFDTDAWDVDLAGQARVQIKFDALTGAYSLLTRPKGVTSKWDVVLKGPAALSDRYLGYSDPDDAIYMLEDTAAGAQVVRRKLAGGASEPVGKVVPGSTPWVKWDPLRSSVIAVGHGGGSATEWLDPDFSAAHAMLSRAFKGKAVSIRSWSRDRNRMIVMVEAADAPPTWYLFDRPRKEISPIGEAYPELAGVALGRTKFMTYKARDGLSIPAYLTVPAKAAAANAKLPLIVMPHGGPSAQDDESFDWMTQFLASRGYAVLRPQYRGSTGFGAELENAGKGEWGGKMQTDLLDGVAALAASGDVDPQRVCIVGASFGGYAALHGAVFNSQAYKCAASIAGVSDLGQLISDTATAFGFDSKSFMLLKAEVRAAAGFDSSGVSPLKNAGKAGTPILLLHGDEDTIVPAAHSKRMAEALRKAGKPVEYVTLIDDNHYLTKTASRQQVLEALDTFLAKNLPVSQVQAAR